MPADDVTWDPTRYLTYADERGRPFHDLLARVRATAPRDVVDLGCGPGNLTVTLRDRWPSARVTGVDSSAEMIARARADHPVRPDLPELAWEVRDLRAYLAAAEPVDVVVSNATLQWVPGHLYLVPALVGAVRPGGWLAFQVPGNVDQPSHAILRELAASEAYVEYTAGVAHPAAHDAVTYLRALLDAGCEVDAWETTYLHVLDARADPDPVFTWISGTGARPVLQALPPALLPGYTEEFRRRLREAYPARDGRVVLPFRRVFAVARRAGEVLA